MPDDPLIGESLKKYNHVTPDYSLGSIVQQELPTSMTQIGDKLYKQTGTYPAPGSWVAASHQEWSWSLLFGGSTETVVFSHHPANVPASDTSSKHNYWTGDYTCLCYKHAQEDNVLLGLYRIPAVSQNVTQAQWIHFWLPKQKFEQVDEEDGWIFIKHRGVYAAIKPLRDGIVSSAPQYEWTTTGQNADLEVKVLSPKAGFIAETADSAEFSGSFADFKAAIKQRPIVYDAAAPHTLAYTGLNGKTVRLDYDTDKRYVDGTEIDFNAYKLHDSPYMSAEWDDGSFTLQYGGNQASFGLSAP
jgi:hypothetical protein